MQISVAKSTRRNATVPNTVAKITEIGFEVLLAPAVPVLLVVGFSEGEKKELVNVPLTAMVCVTVAPRASVVMMIMVDASDGVEDTTSRRAEAETVISGCPVEIESDKH